MGETMRILLVVLAVVALTASAQAQMIDMNQAGKEHERREGGAPPPKEKKAPPSNEKDYKSSLNRLPDQKYDPWAKTR
jgi:hypothetical protein